MGIAEAATSLQSLWLQAEAPALTDVRFSADAIEFRCEANSYVVKGFESGDVRTQFLHCPAPRVKVAFAEIDRIVIFRPDQVVSLHGADGTALLRLKLRGTSEAHSLVDLLASFRASLQRGGSAAPLAVSYDRAKGRIFANSSTMN